jgi:SnoaL-like domain
MSREQKVAVVEAYLDCFATKDLSKVSFAEDVTFEGPRMPKLTGRATILGFLAQILPVVRGIQLKQHIVEGDYVATVFDMETVDGVDHVFDRIHIVDGQIKAIHAFYYPEQPPEEEYSRRTLLSMSSVIVCGMRREFHKGSFEPQKVIALGGL